MSAKYQIYEDVAGKFRFRLRAGNNKIVAVSEAYEAKAGAMNGVKSVQTNCQSKIEDTTIQAQKLPNPKYQVFKDVAGQYRFNLSAANGEIIAQSEAYKTKEGAMNGIEAVQKSCDAEIEGMPVVPAEEPVAKEAVAVAAAPVGSAETKLELYKLPETVTKGQIVKCEGKLTRVSGEAIKDVRIEIREHDRSFLLDEYLEDGYTKDDGSFSIVWKAKDPDWWDDTAEIYAQFRGDKTAKSSRSDIQTIKVK